MKVVVALTLTGLLLLASCGAPKKEYSQDDIFKKKSQENALLAKTTNKPGGVPFEKGKHGGVWVTSNTNDPKSFNPLNEQDAETGAIVGNLKDYLLDYDPYKKQWKPNVVSYEIQVDQKSDKLDMVFTLRDDLYWTTLADPNKKVKVTSDDVVFWYNEIEGDKALQQSGYAQQFMEMPDKSQKHIDIEKIDDRKFKLKFPRIIAMPELACNMDFGPRYIFEPVKKAKGAEGLFNLWSIDTDPKTIPSMGPYYIESYKPGIEVTMVRNPNYWKTDEFGQKLPYIDRVVSKIIANQDTEKLKFKAKELDSFGLRPEDLEDMVKDQNDYTVYSAGAALGASLISWNQNPKNLEKKYLNWFTNQKFRQAMSCFFNRDRVVSQVYRSLAEPAVGFFAKSNPYYDPEVKQQFLFDPERGKKLLAEIGIKPDAAGTMRDGEGNAIEYDMMVVVSTNIAIDIASVYQDELKKVGIKLNVKPLEFQKLVDSLLKGYNWQSVMIGLGTYMFPTQGSNVWVSKGNLHLWNPLQAKPATDWEAKIDELYHKGEATPDKTEAKKIWDEYQHLILDEVPVMFTVHPYSFSAIRNKWGNVFVDSLGSPDRSYFYLKD